MLKTIFQNILKNCHRTKKLNLTTYSCAINNTRFIHNSRKLLSQNDDGDSFTEKETVYRKWQVDQVKDILQEVEKGKYALGEGDSQFVTDVVFDADEEQLLQEEGILIQPSFERKVVQKYERGKTGIFDIETMVEILKAEKAIDIAVLDIPRELKFCDYMVIVCPKSVRHAIAMTENINKIYKVTKHETDRFLTVVKADTDWITMDMMNIVVHIMANKLREDFDIESLWCLGIDYDNKVRDANKEQNSFLVEEPKVGT